MKILVIIFFVLLIATGLTMLIVFNKPTASEEQQNETLPEIINQSNETATPPQENQTFADDPFSNSNQPHWTRMPLTYKIKDKSVCGSTIEKLQDSFRAIEASTENIVTFVESPSADADIEINCIDGEAFLQDLNESVTCKEETYDYDKTRIDPMRENLINASDFLINATKFEKVTIINSTTNETESEFIFTICYVSSSKVPAQFKEMPPTIIQSLIIKSSINIYKPGGVWSACAAFPARETHALLHAFGISHATEPKYDDYYGWASTDILKDIMFADVVCKHQTSINEKYSSCLKNIYSNGEAGSSCNEVNFIQT